MFQETKHMELRRDTVAGSACSLGSVESGESLIQDLAQPLSALWCNASAALDAAQACPHHTCGNVAVLADIVSDCRRLRSALQLARWLARSHCEPRRVVDIQTVVSEAVRVSQGDSRATGVTFRKCVAAGLPGVWMRRGQILEVLLHLMANALDAIRAGGTSRPIIQVHVKAAKDDLLEIAVRDNGMGIAADLLPRLSHEFTSPRPDRNGLGLMLCRCVVERERGQLYLQNNRRSGATVLIRLPLEHAIAG